jgi:hypothetical protein
MAEPVGLAVGILGLAGLFNNAVDCFEYVHLTRSFGKNYQTSLLKLDNARLRLSRWGEAVGLNTVGRIEDVTSLQSTSISKDDIPKAEKVLGELIRLFKETEEKAAEYKIGKSSNELQVHNDNTDLDPLTSSLHLQMRNLSINRQNRTPLRKKVKWALYDEQHFKDLIGKITTLANDLVDLFPAAEEKQVYLGNSEVQAFSESFRVLEAAAKGQDAILEKALSTVLKPAVSTLNL